MSAKKELGQHWLEDVDILQQIVAAGEIGEDDFVLEIGPGKGDLTLQLAKTDAEILALEYDEDLIADLKAKTAYCKKLAISVGDVRTFDFSELPKDYKIVANIPYYLTSHLIQRLAEADNQPARAVLLVQNEVAERLCAVPGDMSILACTAQYFFECSLGIVVPAKEFRPPPKVDSQVVILQRRAEKLFAVDEKQFFRLIKAGFSEKRKTLRNALSGGLRLDKEQVEQLLATANISASQRAQELSLHDWYNLYSAYVSA